MADERRCVICGDVVTPASHRRMTMTCRSRECISAIRSQVAQRRADELRQKLERRKQRTCGVCGRTLPLTEEYFDAVRNPETGEFKRWGQHKACRRVWQRIAYAVAERDHRLAYLAERWREDKERRQSDPEFDRAYRERRRQYRRNSQKGRRGIPVHNSPVDRERAGYLPVGPFLEWVEIAYARFDGTMDDFCSMLDVSERNITRMRSGIQKMVSADTVDRALVNEGHTPLWAIYPSLYDMQEEAA